MRWRGAGALATVIGALLAAPAPGKAQGQLRLTGQIESNVGLETLRVGDRTFETLTRGSRYAPMLEGFVWDPRLLRFSVGGSFADQDTSLPDGTLTISQTEPYRLRVDLLPQAPHSFSLGAFRTVSESLFTGAGETLSVATTEGQEFTWTYRGDSRKPETALSLRRQTTEQETLARRSEEVRTALGLRARRALGRAQPTLIYTAELIERDEPLLGAIDDRGLGHELRYEDRIRVGEGAFLTPTARYRVAGQIQLADASLLLTAPLGTTLDGSGGLRYSFQELAGAVTHVLGANGALTQRLGPDLTVTGGLLGTVVEAEGFTWSTGGFAGVSAAPWPHLQALGDYALQLTGGDLTQAVSHRAHLGAVSTAIPRHVATAHYFLNVFDPGGDQPRFTSQGATLGLTSHLIPLTTLTASAEGDLRQGAGREEVWRLGLEAIVTPVAFLSLRARGEAATRTAAGGGRRAERETALVGEVGVDASPAAWLTFGLSGRVGVRGVDREDKRGHFPTEALRGFAGVHVGALTVRAEGVLEDEPVAELARRGISGSLSYRFRVWTFTVEFLAASARSGGVGLERERVLFRLGRPLDFSWPPR